MIDRLNLAWSAVTTAASPALKNTMDTERARFNGFQPFSGATFSQWATLLNIPVPASPYLEIFNAARRHFRFIVSVNHLPDLHYSLWKTPDLGKTPWTPVTDAVAEVNPTGIQLTDPNAASSPFFYQVRAAAAAFSTDPPQSGAQ